MSARKRAKPKRESTPPSAAPRARAHARVHEAPGPAIGALAGLYALAGAAAFVHEVGWTRIGRTLLGGDAASIAATLAAVLGGMAAGALCARAAARRWGALGGFARLELGAAIYAAAIPWIVPWLDATVGSVVGAGGAGAGHAIVTFGVALALFAPAAIAIGAGLPLLAAARVSTSTTARDAGLLLGAHTLGSAFGGLVAAFGTIPASGVPLSAGLAALLQAVAAAGAFWLARRHGPNAGAAVVAEADSPPEAGSAAATSTAGAGGGTDRAGMALVLGAVLVAGIATIGLQVTWTRLATLALGPSVQGFALTAAMYVLALSIGSAASALLVRRSASPAATQACLLVLACAAVALGAHAAGQWPVDAAAAFASSSSAAQAAASGDAAQAAQAAQSAGAPVWEQLAERLAPVIIPPIALAAAAFPFAIAALARTRPTSVARDVGLLVATASAGNVIGAVVAPFVLVPMLGLARTLLALGVLLIVAAAIATVLVLRPSRRHPRAKAAHVIALVGACVIAAVGIAVAPRQFDPDVLSRGPFLYAGPDAPELGRVIFSHEGVDATVVVREASGERILQIDGKVDASTGGDAPTQTLVGLLPTLLARSPRDALVIGLGSGQTADGIRAVPGVAHVEVAELVDGVRWAAPFFAHSTSNVLGDRRVRVVSTDGARLLRHETRQWDVIVSQPSNPWVSGMGDLFARETFTAARARLRTGGVLAVWFHVYGTSLDIVRALIATFTSVFPDATLWELARGEDYLLVGRAGDGMRIDLDTLVTRSEDPGVARRLARSGIEKPEALLARLVSAGRALRRLGSGAPIISLRDGRLEAWAAEHRNEDASRDALAALVDASVTSRAIQLDARSERAREVRVGAPAALEAGRLARELVIHATGGNEDRAIDAGERAVGLEPSDATIREALATLYLARAKTHALVREGDLSRDAAISVLDLDPSPGIRADALTVLGDLELRAGQTGAALSRYQQARRALPASAELAEKIADCLERLGEREDAERERALARRLVRAAQQR